VAHRIVEVTAPFDRLRDHAPVTETRDPRRQAGEVLATIIRASHSGDETTTELRLESDRWPFDPLAPATLWTNDNQPVIELHRLPRSDGRVAVFESYDESGELPQPGGPYRMYSWWNPDQRHAVTDTTLEWHRRTYNKPGDHTHCILTFEEIDDAGEGYQLEHYGGWISVDAYEKYIRDDVLRLRQPG
jgi:hypothetical protein